MSNRVTKALVTAFLLPAASAATLTGRIVEDHSGSPLPSAEVRVYKIGVRGLAAHLETDGEGRFNASGLSEGEYRIEISKPNHLRGTMHFQLTAAESFPIFVRLIRCGVITGQVTDGQGQPIRGAYVYAMPRPTVGPLRPEFAQGNYGAVDARGRYRLFNLRPGQYAIAVSYGASTQSVGSTGSSASPPSLGSAVLFHPNNASPQFFTITGGEEFHNIDFTVFPSSLYSVGGRVDFPAAQPARGRFWLALTAVDQPALAVAVAQADTEGSFQFTGVPAGSYHLFASGPIVARSSRGAVVTPDTVFARTRVDIGAQNIENISIAPEKGRSVSFALRPAGASCPPAAELVLSPLEDWAAQIERRTPIALGKEQTVSSLAPARYLVSVSGLGGTCHAAEGAVLDLSTASSAATLAIPVYPAGAIHGRFDAGGRRPSDFVIVLLPDLADPSQPVQVALPDAQSRFIFGSLQPGRYRIAAQPAAATVQSRWMAEGSRLVEIDVPGGTTVEMTIAAPALDGAKP